MQVSVENVSNVERRLTVVVPADQVDTVYEKRIAKLAKEANLKGFRQGKAPISHIKQQFGAEARQEALGEVIQHSLHEALKAEKLIPISQPRIESKGFLADQPLEFIATFEILPEMPKINVNLDKIEKLMVDVKDEDKQHVLAQLRKQYTKWNVVDRPAKQNDRVVVDYYAIFDGKSDEANKIQNFPLELGSHVMLPGFEEGLLGVKAGEERRLNLQFPADFSVADRAGKPIDFVVQAKQIFEAEVPTMDEAFIKRLGIQSGSEADLGAQIQQSLEQERNRLVKEKLKEQVFSKLLEQNPLDVPKSLVAREASSIHDEIYPQHQHHDHHQHSDEEMATFNEIAKKRVALGLLIAEFAKQNELKVDKARVQQRIQEIASVYENPKEVIAYLSSEERLGGVEAQVLEDQVLDKLLEGVAISEKAMSYAELKGVRS